VLWPIFRVFGKSGSTGVFLPDSDGVLIEMLWSGFITFLQVRNGREYSVNSLIIRSLFSLMDFSATSISFPARSKLPKNAPGTDRPTSQGISSLAGSSKEILSLLFQNNLQSIHLRFKSFSCHRFA